MRRFTCIQGKHRKYWEINHPLKVNGGWAVEVHFGRIGTAGQYHTNVFYDDAEAHIHYDRKIHEKLGKGYKEAGTYTVKNSVVDYTSDYIPVKPKPCKHDTLTRSGNIWKCSACGHKVEFEKGNPSTIEINVEAKVRRYFDLSGRE